MLQAEQILQQRYKLKQKLAQNSGRQTWLAEDISIQPAKTVIIKFLSFSEQFQWQDLKLFEREAEVLKQLSHPRIPKYIDYFNIEDSNTFFALVEEYIPGYSLKELIQTKHKFTEAEIQKIAIEILEILCYLHSLNPQVIHRDIKPSNLIIGEDKKVYLVDFGAVQDSLAVEGATFTVVGTYGYAPVEQFGGKTVPASDLYALGATLIHLATGKAPADLEQQNMRIQFQDKVSLSPNFIQWIEKLTEPDIQQRFSNATLALNSLKSGIVVNPSYSISKPHGSRIQLTKSQTKLEIDVPSNTNILIRIVVFALDILVILTILLVLLVEPISGLISLLVMGAAQLFLIRMIGGNYIKFDRDRFEIKWKIFGLTYRKQVGKTSEIHKVALKTTNSSVDDEAQKMVLIQTGVKKYGFAGVLIELTNI
ncbi:MAG: serine/threonine-protein kinase, partial [Cyanobacteria bacterium J06628_3]